MISTTENENSPEVVGILKVDALGRVRVPVERRECILDQYERSGMSGAAFAAYVGVKYTTFATWVQKRRRKRQADYAEAKPEASLPASPTSAPSEERLTWVEAQIEVSKDHGWEQASAADSAPLLIVEFAGGARMEINSQTQIGLARRLLGLSQGGQSC